MDYDFDVIVIGSGAGGGTVAYTLAKEEKKVLLLERGSADRQLNHDENQMMIDKIVFENRPICFNNKNIPPIIGRTLGGSTALYGAALLRPAIEDFQPGCFYSKYLEKDVWDWPIQYEHLKPYYDLAEKLYRVAGDDPYKMKNIQGPVNQYAYQAPELTDINKNIAHAISESGYTPFHLPLAIDFDQCEYCPDCPGFFCPNQSRKSSLEVAIEKAIKDYKMQVLVSSEATEIIMNENGKAIGVKVLDFDTSQVKNIYSKAIILSAGAIGSAVLLLRSKLKLNRRLLGKNFMFHAGGITVAIFAHETGGRDQFIKQLGFTDLYFGSAEFPHKLGMAQSVPVPGSQTFSDKIPISIPYKISEKIVRHLIPFMGTVEDLPLMTNRIELGKNNKICVYHRFHDYDLFRAKYYKKILKKIMMHSGAKWVIGATNKKHQGHIAHQTGTVRFGNDPEKSVLDSACRLHYHDNVFVVDGSFMPTSLGVGPALTIIANALRVAPLIKEVC